MNIQDEQFFVRIQSIDFKDFRNIEHGSITFPNSEPLVYREGAPSILGLYGQNGSGKTSTIMALGILKDVLSGNSIGKNYLSCVRQGCNRCSLSFVFSIFSRFVDNKENAVFSKGASGCIELYYDFDIVRRIEEKSDDVGGTKIEESLYIENEVIKYKAFGANDEKFTAKRLMFDTRKVASDDKGIAFGNKRIHDMFIIDEQDKNEFRNIKAIALENGKSFLFSVKFRTKILKFIETVFGDNLKEIANASIMNNVEDENDFFENVEKLKRCATDGKDDASMLYIAFAFYLIQYQLLENLALFGRTYLQVIDTATTGLTNINSTLPLLIWQHTPGNAVYYLKFSLNMDKPTYVVEKYYSKITEVIDCVSNVLNKLVPDMKLSLTDLGKRVNEKNNEEHGFEIISNRGGHSIPLRYESDGIRRMVSVLSLLIAAYNEESFTIAIDEIDSGIFEYLLGELLSVMSDSMKGQFVFTAHNLRPLEVLPAKYLCFTTPNKDHRFTTINKRGNCNLRDTYFRSIILGTNKEAVYNSTDKYEIELALYQAGHPKVSES